jgi:hypothetical protein
VRKFRLLVLEHSLGLCSLQSYLSWFTQTTSDSPKDSLGHRIKSSIVENMRLNFGIAAVATLLSGVRGQDPWPLCTINGLRTECDLSISPSGCCTAPNLAPAITFCNISMDYTPEGTWVYETCPDGAPVCWWSEVTGACCSLLDGQTNGPNDFCMPPV